jgi:ABC-2 type transport system ATP-binding protein
MTVPPRAGPGGDAAIWTEGLTKSFGAVQALRGIDLVVPRGTVLGVLGPNGAGKTTAVRILTTLLRPDSGRAFIEGRDVVSDPAGVREVIGLAGQSAAIQDDLTGKENLEICRRRSRALGPANCGNASPWPTPGIVRPRPTPAVCSGAWTWPPA